MLCRNQWINLLMYSHLQWVRLQRASAFEEQLLVVSVAQCATGLARKSWGLRHNSCSNLEIRMCRGMSSAPSLRLYNTLRMKDVERWTLRFHEFPLPVTQKKNKKKTASVYITVVVGWFSWDYSHSTETRMGQVQGMGLGVMGPKI